MVWIKCHHITHQMILWIMLPIPSGDVMATNCACIKIKGNNPGFVCTTKTWQEECKILMKEIWGYEYNSWSQEPSWHIFCRGTSKIPPKKCTFMHASNYDIRMKNSVEERLRMCSYLASSLGLFLEKILFPSHAFFLSPCLEMDCEPANKMQAIQCHSAQAPPNKKNKARQLKEQVFP